MSKSISRKCFYQQMKLLLCKQSELLKSNHTGKRKEIPFRPPEITWYNIQPCKHISNIYVLIGLLISKLIYKSFLKCIYSTIVSIYYHSNVSLHFKQRCIMFLHACLNVNYQSLFSSSQCVAFYLWWILEFRNWNWLRASLLLESFSYKREFGELYHK